MLSSHSGFTRLSARRSGSPSAPEPAPSPASRFGVWVLSGHQEERNWFTEQRAGAGHREDVAYTFINTHSKPSGVEVTRWEADAGD